ncbi:MAG TPA: pentapeptide repeat-containing protein, partial [Mycobacteriales bacterium]|nr:pentapeptide repeat-containing protein [Mycobacteriales bacterium]
SLRFSTLQRVTFTDCAFVAGDFYGVTFDRVTFTRCDLSGACFDNATVKDLTLTQCALLGVTGALSLRGAVVDLDDLPGLAPSLAREAGLRFTVED